MKIKIVFNNCNWTSIDEKIVELSGWFSSFSPKIDYVKTDFKDIPFVPYDSNDPTVLGVGYVWYDENISPLGLGYDIVLLVMPRSEWKEPNRARGWRVDNTLGCVELQITADEFQTNSGGWPFDKNLTDFYLLSRHEIMHALYMLSGQLDRTHYWWSLGKLESARDEIRLPHRYWAPGLIKAINYLQKLLLARLSKK